MVKLLLNRSNTARVFTFDHIYYLLWQFQFFFIYDFGILDDIYGNVVIDKAENIKVNITKRTFYFDDVLFAHFIAAGVFDDGNGTVQFVQF